MNKDTPTPRHPAAVRRLMAGRTPQPAAWSFEATWWDRSGRSHFYYEWSAGNARAIDRAIREQVR